MHRFNYKFFQLKKYNMDICWLREISWWVFIRKNLTIYSFFTQPCDIKQSLLNLNHFYLSVKKKGKNLWSSCDLQNWFGVIPLWMFCIMTECIMCLTNISILCEGLCESTDEGQGKRMCMPLTIPLIPNTATYLPSLSSLPISFIGFIGSRYLV